MNILGTEKSFGKIQQLVYINSIKIPQGAHLWRKNSHYQFPGTKAWEVEVKMEWVFNTEWFLLGKGFNIPIMIMVMAVEVCLYAKNEPYTSMAQLDGKFILVSESLKDKNANTKSIEMLWQQQPQGIWVNKQTNIVIESS